MPTATAIAHPNIALCKYWGKRDVALNLPATPSISLTVAPFSTRTTVDWGAAPDYAATADELVLNGELTTGLAAKKVFAVLDLLDAWRPRCRVVSDNDFPTAAGLASSSSGFAALVVAADAAATAKRGPIELSVLARRGSGSAARSIYGGWSEWKMGERADGADSFAVEIAPVAHWDVRLVVAIFDSGPKSVSSTDGMIDCERSSPFWKGWLGSAPADVVEARGHIQRRDLEALGEVMERSALRMHACMMASDPPIFYWKSGTVWAMEAVRELRRRGIACAFTIDAGPNVKVLCAAEDAEAVRSRLAAVADRVEVLHPGGPASVVA